MTHKKYAITYLHTKAKKVLNRASLRDFVVATLNSHTYGGYVEGFDGESVLFIDIETGETKKAHIKRVTVWRR